VDLAVDKLVVEGRKVTTAAASTLCHFAVHKPVGYICSNVSKQPGMRAVDLLRPWLDQWQQKHKVRSLHDCHPSFMCAPHNWIAALMQSLR
jgi:16S rRNA U516 pseudouridylate synthase RsuA-like enzyme